MCGRVRACPSASLFVHCAAWLVIMFGTIHAQDYASSMDSSSYGNGYPAGGVLSEFDAPSAPPLEQYADSRCPINRLLTPFSACETCPPRNETERPTNCLRDTDCVAGSFCCLFLCEGTTQCYNPTLNQFTPLRAVMEPSTTPEPSSTDSPGKHLQPKHGRTVLGVPTQGKQTSELIKGVLKQEQKAEEQLEELEKKHERLMEATKAEAKARKKLERMMARQRKNELRQREKERKKKDKEVQKKEKKIEKVAKKQEKKEKKQEEKKIKKMEKKGLLNQTSDSHKSSNASAAPTTAPPKSATTLAPQSTMKPGITTTTPKSTSTSTTTKTTTLGTTTSKGLTTQAKPTNATKLPTNPVTVIPTQMPNATKPIQTTTQGQVVPVKNTTAGSEPAKPGYMFAVPISGRSAGKMGRKIVDASPKAAEDTANPADAPIDSGLPDENVDETDDTGMDHGATDEVNSGGQVGYDNSSAMNKSPKSRRYKGKLYKNVTDLTKMNKFKPGGKAASGKRGKSVGVSPVQSKLGNSQMSSAGESSARDKINSAVTGQLLNVSITTDQDTSASVPASRVASTDLSLPPAGIVGVPLAQPRAGVSVAATPLLFPAVSPHLSPSNSMQSRTLVYPNLSPNFSPQNSVPFPFQKSLTPLSSAGGSFSNAFSLASSSSRSFQQSSSNSQSSSFASSSNMQQRQYGSTATGG